MEDIYYKRNYIISLINKIKYLQIKKLEFRALVFNTSEEIFRNKYRLIYGREFEELEIDRDKHEAVINLLSNDGKIHIDDLNNLFYDFDTLEYLDISSFDTGKVIEMTKLFYNCSSLREINLSNFDTSSVKSMSHMFYGCKSLKNLDISNFDTHNVTFMGSMFAYCTNIEDLNLSNFDTHNVVDMFNMFCYCEKLKKLDMSNFNTDKAYLGCMFDFCKDIEIITDNTKIINSYNNRR